MQKRAGFLLLSAVLTTVLGHENEHAIAMSASSYGHPSPALNPGPCETDTVRCSLPWSSAPIDSDTVIPPTASRTSYATPSVPRKLTSTFSVTIETTVTTYVTFSTVLPPGNSASISYTSLLPCTASIVIPGILQSSTSHPTISTIIASTSPPATSGAFSASASSTPAEASSDVSSSPISTPSASYSSQSASVSTTVITSTSSTSSGSPSITSSTASASPSPSVSSPSIQTSTTVFSTIPSASSPTLSTTTSASTLAFSPSSTRIPPAPSVAGTTASWGASRGKEKVWWLAFFVPFLLAA